MIKSNYSYVVIDDDLKVCESIQKRMLKYSNWQCKALLVSLSESVSIIEKEKPNLLFLDWSIKGGNAFILLEKLEQFQNYKPYIIFFTGYQSDHPEIPVELINRFKINRYLVKPIYENLTNHLDEYINDAESIIVKNKKDFLWITTTEKTKIMLFPNQIVCISQSRINSRNKIIHYFDKNEYEIKASWVVCEKIAKDFTIDYSFANSRDTLVNKKFITKFQKPKIWINNQFWVEVTKEKSKDFF